MGIVINIVIILICGVFMVITFKKVLMVFTIIIIILPIAICGCGKKQKNTEEVIDYLKNIDTYSCDIEMYVTNDKQNIVYDGRQYYSRNLGYRFEINGERVLLYIGKNIYVKDLKSQFQYTTEKDFDNMYKLSFIGEYIGLLYTNEEVKNSFKNVDGKEFQVIELIIPGGNRNVHKAELYVNLENYLPDKLLVYDYKNKEKVKVIYKNFLVNSKLDGDLFKIN